MVNFERFVLDNGLKVLIHQDRSTPIAVVNVLYNVGARDEHPDHTGFAHLFEHLMFEGSVNIPGYDNTLQLAGGENNAFTNNDITNYYLTLPRHNLETALWLESDRMLGLSFSEEKLRIQKNVVTEEFRQSYLNQPYGDVWLLLRPLLYKVHPYQWPTIGKSIEHIKSANLAQVEEFFFKYYRPNNAILVVSGNVEAEPTLELIRKWFAEIPSGKPIVRDLPAEPPQTQARKLAVERDVPYDEIYLAFHTGTRLDDNFYTTDVITDILAGGQSGRLRENLVKKRKIFSETNAWISGSFDKGFLAITGRLNPGQDIHTAREALWEELMALAYGEIDDYEFQKIKNKIEANHTFAEAGILSRSVNLAWYECLGDAALLNEQIQKYFDLTREEVQETAKNIFRPEQVSELHYLAKK
ncbi:MAG: M16 family metallopeptidase [Bacteroidota bacterium]